MTLIEQAALLLAAEVESCIRIGVPMTTACINALDQFRKTQLTKGSELDRMIQVAKQAEQQECKIIQLRKLKIVKEENEKK
jgi:hypothetical protein